MLQETDCHTKSELLSWFFWGGGKFLHFTWQVGQLGREMPSLDNLLLFKCCSEEIKNENQNTSRSHKDCPLHGLRILQCTDFED